MDTTLRSAINLAKAASFSNSNAFAKKLFLFCLITVLSVVNAVGGGSVNAGGNLHAADEGSNAITTAVTAHDRATNDNYNATVNKLSSDATLALLQIPGQTISPAFATAINSYTSTVPNGTISIKVEAFTNNSAAKVTINGYAVASGAASPALPLIIGNNTITIIVTAQDGVTKDTYTIMVTRVSTVATLALLQIIL